MIIRCGHRVGDRWWCLGFERTYLSCESGVVDVGSSVAVRLPMTRFMDDSMIAARESQGAD